jgi:hypothetical protein
MPGDPAECRAQGFRCEALAAEAQSDEIKHSLMELSRIWFGLAEAIDQTQILIALEALKLRNPGES